MSRLLNGICPTMMYKPALQMCTQQHMVCLVGIMPWLNGQWLVEYAWYLRAGSPVVRRPANSMAPAGPGTWPGLLLHFIQLYILCVHRL